MATQTYKTRNQVRGFVLIWTFITLAMGMATFLAIYFAYQPEIEASIQSVANNSNNSSGQVVVIESQTPLPVTPAAPIATQSRATAARPQNAAREPAHHQPDC